MVAASPGWRSSRMEQRLARKLTVSVWLELHDGERLKGGSLPGTAWLTRGSQQESRAQQFPRLRFHPQGREKAPSLPRSSWWLQLVPRDPASSSRHWGIGSPGQLSADTEVVGAPQGHLMPRSCPGLTPDLLSCPSRGLGAIAGFFPETLRFDCLASLKAVPWAVGWALLGFHRQHNSHPLKINRLEPLRIQRFNVKFGFLASLEILEDVMFDLHRLNHDAPCRQGMAPVRQQKAHEPAVVALNHLSKLWPPHQSPTSPA